MKTILVDAWNTFVIDRAVIDQDMFELLESFENPKIIVTNADDRKMEEFGLTEMPYEVFTLKMNPSKTDPEYFHILLDKLGLTAQQVVYFEHNPKAVKSAQSLGIKSYHFDHQLRDLEGLKNFLEQNI